MHSQWGIGGWTPSILVALYILALGIAITHYIFYNYLDGRLVDGPDANLLQSHVSIISTAFVFLFRACLSASLATAFTQHIWRVFRRKSLDIQTIDRIYNVLMSPFNLFSAHLVKYAIWELLFAFLCFSLPLATVFPPGALKVITINTVAAKFIEVPTFDPSFKTPLEDHLGDGRMNRMHMVKQAVYSVTEDGEFYRPLPVIIRPVKQSLLGGGYLTLPPPTGCGQNCTYTITFPGPSFNCSERENKTFATKNAPWYKATDSYKVASLYGEIGGNQFIRTYDVPKMNFLVTWRNSPKQSNATYRTASCDLHHTIYKVNVTYNQGVQVMDVDLEKNGLIDGRALTYNKPFSVKAFTNKEVVLGKGMLGQTNQTLSTIFMDSQLRAIRDSVVMAIEGSILENDPLISTDTLILETKWQYDNRKDFDISLGANYSYTSPLAISAEGLESLLINATLSTIVSGGWTTSANATIHSTETVYSFSRPRLLIAPYAVALGIGLLLILIGGRALILNGVSAESGGFLQAISTTSGSKTVAAATMNACLGGMKNFRNGNVKNVVLKYGGLRSQEVFGNDRSNETSGVDPSQGDEENKTFLTLRRAGFGRPEEVVPLRKGDAYGG
ncbi:hypothetical protein DFH27DRAFT_579557 [Peziza echinospora]|nr:hypothetical protein DFH27DRAFT_579557 [Peziza echinospora]